MENWKYDEKGNSKIQFWFKPGLYSVSVQSYLKQIQFSEAQVIFQTDTFYNHRNIDIWKMIIRVLKKYETLEN